MNYTIYYRDHLGRKNQSQFSGIDEAQAQDKFKILHPDCVVVDVEQTKL